MTSVSPPTEYLQNQKFIAFDTETTGLWAPAHRLVEIAAVKFRLADDNADTFQSLINPQRPIPADVTGIHGITDEMVADAPTVRSVLKQFIEFCGDDAILIAHNAPFDISFLSCELDRVGLIFPHNLILDTVDIYHRLYPELESYSLLALVTIFDIAKTQEHRALEDAHLVRRLFIKAIERFGSIGSLEEFKSLFTTATLADWPGLVKELPTEFGELNRALKDNLRVEITYQPESKPAHNRVIRPKQVCFLGSTFYIYAYCERARAERTFRLDRIETFRVLDN
ncbi:MAG: exonuclease domain-containing protein [Candidatus Zixiibacteriota bacterium]